MIALRAEGLRKSVELASGDRLHLLRGVDLELDGGQSLAIVGRSGSGKSTLLAVLGLLLAADSGSISIAGHSVESLGDRQRSFLRNEHIGFVFQNYSLLGHLNAAENVALPLMQGRRVDAKESRRRVRDALDAVGLSARAHSRPRQLSGGEQQRVAIARAIVRSPAVILADEPTGALDTTTANHVLTTLTGIVREQGASLVLVTHDLDVASRADRVVSLANGEATAVPVTESRESARCA